MWKNMIRNMEWLVIVALLVGAVMAVGCVGTPTSVGDPKIVAPDKITFLGSDSTIYGMYKDEFDSPVEGGTWTFVSSDNGTTPAHTTGTFNSTAGGLPLAISFTQTGIYQFKFAKTNLEKTVKVYVYATAGPSQTVEIGNVATIGGGMTPLDPLHTITVSCTELGINAQNPTGPISFTQTKVGVFNIRYAVWLSSGVLGEDSPVLADVNAIITVIDPNPAPAGIVVNAGVDRYAAVGSTIVLNGLTQGGSSPAGQWSLLRGPAGSSLNQLSYDAVNQKTPLEFTASQTGEYVLKLTYDTYVSLVKVRVCPIADAGPAQTVTVGSKVTLVGNVNGFGIASLWTETSSSGVTLTPVGNTSVTFTQNIAGTYTFKYGFYEPHVTEPMTFSEVTIHVVEAAGATEVAALRLALANNTYLVSHSSASSDVLEIFEFLSINGYLMYRDVNLTGQGIQRTSV